MVAAQDLHLRIEELERVQRRTETIAQINASLSRAMTEQDVLSAVARLAEQHGVVMSVLAYAETDSRGNVVAADITAAQAGNGTALPLNVLPVIHFPLSDNPILEIALDYPDEPLFVENVFTDPRMETGMTRAVFQQMGMTATIILWFRTSGQWQGVMTFNWAQPQPFDPDLRAIFQAIQPVAAAVIANRRLMSRLEALAEENAQQANLYKGLVENSVDSIIVFELPSNLVIYANKACHQTFGYDYQKQEMLQLSGRDMWPESELDYAQTELPSLVLQSGWSGEVRQKRKNGEIFDASVTVFAIRQEDGTPIRMCAIIRDISEQKRAELERTRLQEQIIDAQRQTLQELSTPIIPLMDGIIVMPLVGAIDTMRSRDIMRSLLEGVTQYRAKIAILDITGVSVVDSGVADHLNRTIQAARLKGAHTIITGVSDAVAETVIDLGIDWSKLETLRDLQTGLTSALNRMGIQLGHQPSTNGKKEPVG